jgi:predicted Zn-dependent peptidase
MNALGKEDAKRALHSIAWSQYTPRNAAGPRWAKLALIVVAGWFEMVALAQFDSVQSRITEFTLHNGMKFIVLERHQAPVVSCYTYADVGSVQEVKGITGLAHLFEHMAFKGTTRIGTKNYPKEKAALDNVDRAFDAWKAEREKGRKADAARLRELETAFKAAQEAAGRFVARNEFGEIIERAGGRGLNASTSSDRTDYFFSLPSNQLELWFHLESERFLDPVFREFYQEKDVVMEERRMSVENQPIGKLLEEFTSVAYKAHPYGESVLGHMSDLQLMSRADAQAFFTKYYVAGNLIGVVVGDVAPPQVRQFAQAYFGRLPKRSLPEPLRTVEPAQVGERRVALHLEAQRLVLVGYHSADINSPEAAAYDALSSLLSEGRSSRLYRRLVRDKQLAVAAGGFPGLPGLKYPGLFLFYAFVAPGHTNQELENAIQEETERLKNEPVNTEELAGVKQRARANLVRSLEDNTGMAANLAMYQGLTGDWRNLFQQLARINAVAPADIQRIAKATFTFDNRTVGTIDPVATPSPQP